MNPQETLRFKSLPYGRQHRKLRLHSHPPQPAFQPLDKGLQSPQSGYPALLYASVGSIYGKAVLNTDFFRGDRFCGSKRLAMGLIEE
jgi:hypothetical protein